MDFKIDTAGGERKWVAMRDLPAETLLGCEAPWLLRSFDRKTTFLSPNHACDWRLTEQYLDMNAKWKKEHSQSKGQECLGNSDVLFSKLRHHKERKLAKKSDFYELAHALATKFNVPFDQVVQIHSVMSTNAFSPGCFLESSYVNHSCNHNAIMLWSKTSLSKETDGKLKTVKIDCPQCHFADSLGNQLHFLLIKPVRKGEEITINYFALHPDMLEQMKIGPKQVNMTLPLRNLVPSKKRRRMQLLKKFGFLCLCSVCQEK